MESPTVLAVMLMLLVFRTSVRAAAMVAQGLAEIGVWMALAAMGMVMACEWVVGGRATDTASRW
jgi:hypothetical protein